MSLKAERFLDAAVAAARRALRDLEDEQIPETLRRIAGYAGGSLPPPYARSLLRELATNEFLRSKALEALGADGDTPRSRASALFLEQGDGWLFDLLELAHDSGDRSAERSDQALRIERDGYEAEAAALREKVRTLRAELERTEQEARDAQRAARAPAKADRSVESRLRIEIEALEQALASERAQTAATAAELQAKVDAARHKAKRHRRERAELAASLETAGHGMPGSGADDVAKHLDRLASVLSSDVVSAEVLAEAAAAGGLPPLVFPSSIRPDGPEAVEWLRALGDASVVIDGYNLGFKLLSGRLDPGLARRRVDEVLRRLGAAPGLQITVVYDSAMDGDLAQPSEGLHNVVYSGGRSGDDVVVDLAGAGGRVVVVSNDREVRERAEARGAVAMWSDAVVAWSRRR